MSGLVLTALICAVASFAGETFRLIDPRQPRFLHPALLAILVFAFIVGFGYFVLGIHD